MQSPGLLAHHDGKPAALAHQLLGRTVFDDLALLDGDDAMGVANSRQAMRDNQHRPALADLLHVRLDRRFGFHVQRSEEHTSELQSLMSISYAVFCLQHQTTTHHHTNYKITPHKYTLCSA